MTNISAANLNRDMIVHLDLNPGMTLCDLGSGVGLTSCTFAKFGCYVTGFEIQEKSTEIAKFFA